MRQFFGKMVAVAGGLIMSGVAFADSHGGSGGAGFIALSAGLAVGLGTIGAALGQGKAASSALEGIARNPTSKNDVFTPFILALAFMELLGLLAFVISILLWLKVQ